VEFKHYFTLEEAQTVLAEVRTLVDELVELKQILDRKGYDVYKHQYFGGMGPNGQKVFPPQMERLVAIVAQLNERGIDVKDLDKGLIDFPCRRKTGEVVYLCYMHGEPTILSWHPVDSGFKGRQPLEDL
jgi:hypothetical protein